MPEIKITYNGEVKVFERPVTVLDVIGPDKNFIAAYVNRRVRGVDAGDITRGLHHTTQGEILTDGIDAIVDSLYGPDEVLGHSWVDNLLCVC